MFISHSRKDEDLVLAIGKALKNMRHTPVIQEFIPVEERRPVPHEEIKRNVEKSNFVFVFLTDNVVSTPFTQGWVNHEVGLASAYSKKLFVFERVGTPIKFTIPYLTDYALFHPDKTKDILELQNITKDLGKFKHEFLAAGGGVAIGSMFGPIGMVIGGILGYLVWPKDPKHTTVKCDNCNVSFNYHSTYRTFKCPSCRSDIDLK